MKKHHFILIIFIAGFIVYFNSLFNNFVWDDEEQIVKNTIIQDSANLSYLFRSGTFYGGGAGLSGWFYRPLVTLSYMINFAVWKFNPFGYHLFQLLLHLTNAILIFHLFREILSRESGERLQSELAAFLVALIFAIHPALAEAVSYIASIGEVLYTFFNLLAFWLLLKESGRPALPKLFIFSLFLLLAWLAKESAAAIIPIIWLYLLIFRRKRESLSWSVATVAVFLFYLYLRLGVVGLPVSHPRYAPISEAGLSLRLLTVPAELFSYLRLFFFPLVLAISRHFVVDSLRDFQFWGAAVGVFIFFLLTLFLFLKTRSRVLLFFSFWFLFSIGLVVNIFPLDMTIAERWFYFPIIGLLGMFGVALARSDFQLAPLPRRSLASGSATLSAFIQVFCLVSLSLWLLFLGLRTVIRNTNWRSGLTLYSHDIKISQNSFDLENNLGVELFRAGRYEEAKKRFERSIALQPKWWFAHNNLGAVYQRAGELKKARELYEETIKIADYYLAYENLAFVMLKTSEPAESIVFTKAAVGKFPQNSKLSVALALAYYQNEEYDLSQIEAQRAYLLESSPQNRRILEAIINKEKIDF